MMLDETEDTTIYIVLVNSEEQYCIWPEYNEIPKGWKAVGKPGPKQECLDYVKEVWTDMRPLSVRKKMEEMERKKASENQRSKAKAPTKESSSAAVERST